MDSDTVAGLTLGGFCVLIIGAALTLCLWGCPQYNVYSEKMNGEAELARADQNRQVQVADAQGKLDAAKLLNQADIERAKGVAGANQIIGDSLKNNEAYLRYLWIDSIKESKDQIIYVPTEAQLPILEASRHINNLTKQQGDQ